MRIISGTLGGRVLQPPMKKWPTRPTTDIAKEALYNILSNRIDFEDAIMLDLFGGTGAHVFEFLSRGCTNVTYVDMYPKCVSWVKKQIKSLDFEEEAKVVRMDVAKFIKRQGISEDPSPFNFIFADPPYALPWLPQLASLILDNSFLTEDGLLVIEHGSDVNYESHSRCTETRKYGQSRFSFFN